MLKLWAAQRLLRIRACKLCFFAAMSVFLFVSQCISHIIFDNFLRGKNWSLPSACLWGFDKDVKVNAF